MDTFSLSDFPPEVCLIWRACVVNIHLFLDVPEIRNTHVVFYELQSERLLSMAGKLNPIQRQALELGVQAGRDTQRAFSRLVEAYSQAPDKDPEMVRLARALTEPALLERANLAGVNKSWILHWGDSWFKLGLGSAWSLPYYVKKQLNDPNLKLGDYSSPAVEILKVALKFEDMIDNKPDSGSGAQGNLIDLLADFKTGLSNKESPGAILLSMSGNDFVEAHRGRRLLYEKSGTPSGINHEGLETFLNSVESRYLAIAAAITYLWEATFGSNPGLARPRIITHGYGNTHPDGRTSWDSKDTLTNQILHPMGLFNWLKPTFVDLGYKDLSERTALMKEFMEALNGRMAKFSSHEFEYTEDGVTKKISLSHLVHCDLRTPLEPRAGETYKTVWINELHLTQTGLDRAAVEMAKIIVA
jgi:hypothetical protein